MAAKKVELKEMGALRVWSRKMGLAYLGAFGVASDELAKFFERLVKRGEQVELNVRKGRKQRGKESHQLAHELQKEQKAAVAKAQKSVKKATQKIHALA